MKQRFFSLEEARRLIPTLEPLVGRLVSLSGQLEKFREVLKKVQPNASSGGGMAEGADYVTRLLALQACVEEVQELGCLVKGVQEGLVDFPHLKDGREVYLCWKLGENDIGFWHEIDSGFSGRTPLSEN